MDKHKALINNSVAAPKLVGSITTKGQNPTDEDNFQGGFHCVPGQREQPRQCPRTSNLIQSLYSNRTDLQKISQKMSITEPVVEPAKQQNFSSMFLSSKLTQEHHKLQNKVLIFEFSVENSWINYIHFDCWKYINRIQAAYNRMQWWSKTFMKTRSWTQNLHCLWPG